MANLCLKPVGVRVAVLIAMCVSSCQGIPNDGRYQTHGGGWDNFRAAAPTAPDNRFDTLSALEAWVEHGKAPDVIQACTRPESPVQHRLPLCPYPQQARYRGTGEIADPSNWSCAAGTAE
jgi:hypothetical protein